MSTGDQVEVEALNFEDAPRRGPQSPESGYPCNIFDPWFTKGQQSTNFMILTSRTGSIAPVAAQYASYVYLLIGITGYCIESAYYGDVCVRFGDIVFTTLGRSGPRPDMSVTQLGHCWSIFSLSSGRLAHPAFAISPTLV